MKRAEHLAWDRRGWWWRVPIILILLGATLVPFYLLVVTSLKTSGDYILNPFGLPRSLDIANWAEVISAVQTPAWNSTVIAVATAGILLFIMAPAAYIFTWHRFPGKEKLFTFAILTMMMPAVITMVPLYIQIRDMGALDTKWAVILPGVAGSIGITLFLLRAFFKALPEDLVEAARVDGASELQIMGRIVLPLSVPGLVTVAVLTISGSWNQYLWPLITLTSKTEQVAVVAAANFSSDPLAMNDTPALMAAYLVSSAPLIVMMALLLRYFMAGALAGAIKG